MGLAGDAGLRFDCGGHVELGEVPGRGAAGKALDSLAGEVEPAVDVDRLQETLLPPSPRRYRGDAQVAHPTVEAYHCWCR